MVPLIGKARLVTAQEAKWFFCRKYHLIAPLENPLFWKSLANCAASVSGRPGEGGPFPDGSRALSRPLNMLVANSVFVGFPQAAEMSKLCPKTNYISCSMSQSRLTNNAGNAAWLANTKCTPIWWVFRQQRCVHHRWKWLQGGCSVETYFERRHDLQVSTLSWTPCKPWGKTATESMIGAYEKVA